MYSWQLVTNPGSCEPINKLSTNDWLGKVKLLTLVKTLFSETFKPHTWYNSGCGSRARKGFLAGKSFPFISVQQDH